MHFLRRMFILSHAPAGTREAGRSVVNFVLDAEAALLTNQSLLKQARRAVSIARLVLDLSIGRIERRLTVN